MICCCIECLKINRNAEEEEEEIQREEKAISQVKKLQLYRYFLNSRQKIQKWNQIQKKFYPLNPITIDAVSNCDSSDVDRYVLHEREIQNEATKCE